MTTSEFKPRVSSRAKNPVIWKQWKMLRDLSQKMQQSIDGIKALGIDVTDLEVSFEAVVDLSNNLHRRI